MIDSVVAANQASRRWEIPRDSQLTDTSLPSRSVSSASMSLWDEDMIRAIVHFISTPSPLLNTDSSGESVPMPELLPSSSGTNDQETYLPHPSPAALSTSLLPSARNQDAGTFYSLFTIMTLIDSVPGLFCSFDYVYTTFFSQSWYDSLFILVFVYGRFISGNFVILLVGILLYDGVCCGD